MPTANRQARLGSLLHQEIALAVQQELDDPRCGLITISRVELTGDLHHVTAYYTVYGDGAAQVRAAKALERIRTLVQARYAKVVRTRLLPILSFRPDVAEVRRVDMDDLIHRARATDTDRGARPEPASPQPPPTA